MTNFRSLPASALCLVLALAMFGAGLAIAATTLQIAVPAGVTTIEIDGVQVQIEASAEVIVSLLSSGGEITGEVTPAPGVRSAEVTITVLGSPDVVIFNGKVTSATQIERYFFTEETGRGES